MQMAMICVIVWSAMILSRKAVYFGVYPGGVLVLGSNLVSSQKNTHFHTSVRNFE
jgi:hypothetical protein